MGVHRAILSGFIKPPIHLCIDDRQNATMPARFGLRGNGGI